MSSSSLDLNFDQLYLEIPAIAHESRDRFSTAGALRRAELNQCCLDAFLPWLREEQTGRPQVWTREDALPSFWELVNGTAISINTIRLVLIPSEAIDLNELRVPQEWVDIPSWAADYYISVQVNLEEDWLRIVGYVTHYQLKTVGTYDGRDRTYCFNTPDLIQNLNVLWLAREFCPGEPLRAEIPPLPTLPQAQAENLLDRLGNPEIVFPRLEIPFQLWGGLLVHGGWRQRLYEKRQGLPEQWSIQRWLQTGISNLAQQFGWESIEGLSAPMTTGTRTSNSSSTPGLSRHLIIVDQSYELRIFSPDPSLWRFELRSASGSTIPAGLTLRLLTEDLQPFENNSDTATSALDYLYVEVILEPGEALVWETEPSPENYDREILRF